MNTSKPVMLAVVAAVIERGDEILIARRRRGARHALKWEFPGGKVEPGESPRAALRRELREELAISAKIGPEITRYGFTYPGRHPFLLIFFKVTEFRGEPQALTFDSIVWEKRYRLPSYDFLEGDVNFVRSLARM